MKPRIIKIWPENGFRDLEFDKVLKIIADFAVGEEARELALNLMIYAEQELIKTNLGKLEDFVFLRKHSKVAIAEYQNIRIELRNLAIEDFILSHEDVMKFYDVLLNIEVYRTAILSIPNHTLRFLIQDIEQVFDPSQLISYIRKVFDKDRNIRDDASEELSNIRRRLRTKNAEIYKVFKKIVASLKSSGVLAEEEEGIRNGRLVVRLLAEHRRKIHGIIHDRSEGGRTIYVEPQEVVELNNELYELQSDEKAEILKVLSALCRSMRPFAKNILIAYEYLIQWDVLNAKAQLAESMNAVQVQIENERNMQLKKAKHPLFYLRLKELNKEFVPFGFYLNEKNRILLISGPNAGGKSVTLKSVGLIQLMFQAGLFVPVDKSSQLRVFESMMIDIGDHQSMEDELSTYSARLSNMRDFVTYADESTIVLIDEFGSGTEPQIGGAIAESVLKTLGEKKVFAIINTHYSNLKAFAHKHEGFVNAAMVFDEKNLAPTYQLAVGRPGSSYALEIANKVQLPTELIDYVKKRIGDQTVSFENLLSSLDKEINILRKQVDDYQNKQLELDRLIQSYDQIHKQYEYKRLKLRLEQKQFEVLLKSNKQKELNAYIDEIQKLKTLEELEKKADAKRKELEVATHELVQMNHELHQLSTKEQITPIEEGDTVKMIFSGMLGRVTKIEKGRVYVETDTMTFNMKPNELLKMNPAIDVRHQQSIQTNVQKSGGTFNTILDIRGMRLQEAQEKFDLYLDRALLANVNKVYVIHGIGNGILKRDLQRTLKNLSFVKSFSQPEEEGGGTTMIEFS